MVLDQSVLPVRRLKEVLHLITREFATYLSNPSSARREKSTFAIGLLIASLKMYEADEGQYVGRIVCVLPSVIPLVLLKIRYNTRYGRRRLRYMVTEGTVGTGQCGVVVDQCELLVEDTECGTPTLLTEEDDCGASSEEYSMTDCVYPQSDID